MDTIYNKEEKGLLTLKETCLYLNLGVTKTRELLKKPDSTFTVRIGNRLYSNKKLLDDYIDRCAKYQIPIE